MGLTGLRIGLDEWSVADYQGKLVFIISISLDISFVLQD